MYITSLKVIIIFSGTNLRNLMMPLLLIDYIAIYISYACKVNFVIYTHWHDVIYFRSQIKRKYEKPLSRANIGDLTQKSGSEFRKQLTHTGLLFHQLPTFNTHNPPTKGY